jgi:hypothetical protein
MKKHEVQEREIYKIITGEHFFFLYYDDKKVSGAGGGTYSVDNNTFTETLNYYSWDSTAVGTQQTFNWTIEGNVLHQTGLIKGTNNYDDYVIDEYYERVEEDFTESTHPLVGVWEVEKSTYGTSTKTAEESKWIVQKVFTPRFWYVAYRNRSTGSYNGVGFGTYTLEGDQYVETIAAYSWDQSAVGKTHTFTMELGADRLVQRGKIDTEEYKHYVIVERFRRIE